MRIDDVDPAGDLAGLLIWLLCVLAALTAAVMLYLIPTVIAYRRGTRNQARVLVVSMLLGWTVVGWVVGLVSWRAARARNRRCA